VRPAEPSAPDRPTAGDRYDAVVVGAGISGLAAAFRLARAGLRTAVLEAAGGVGGVVRTRTVETEAGRFLFELGPNTVAGGRPELDALIAEAGLAPELLAADPAARRRWILRRGRLVPLPSGPLAALTTPLLSGRGKLRLLAEPFVRRRERGADPRPAERRPAGLAGPDGGAVPGDDETIAGFVRRRLGPEALDAVVEPFVAGVWAGDPERLAARWAMPRLHALEAEHGSLVRGALAAAVGRRRSREPSPRRARALDAPVDTEARSAERDRPTLLGFGDGLAALPRALARALEVRTGCACRAVRRGPDGGLLVDAEDGAFRARHVVLAVGATATARLLAGATGGAADPLLALPHASVAVAGYGFRREDVRHPLDGFGFLAARGERLRILGCLFPSSIFPGRAPEGHVALTVFLGGRTDPGAIGLDDEALHRTALAELDRTLGLAGEPVARTLARWPDGIPQYEVGHGRYVELAAELERAMPGLHLCGSWLGGISLPDRVERAAETARAVLAGP